MPNPGERGVWGRRAVTTSALVVVAVGNMGADGGCAPNSNAPADSKCAGVQNSRLRAECLHNERGEKGNELSPVGAQLMQDMLTTYAQGKPFPWRNYRFRAVEDRTTVGVLKDGDVLNTDVFPQVADLMIGPNGEKTDKTNAVAYCAVALSLDSERYGPISASMEGAIAGALVGIPIPGAIVGAGTYIEVRDKIIPYLFREGLKEEEAAIAGGGNRIDAENNKWYAAVRGLCDDTFPVHGLGSLAKGWGGANPLKSASESEVRQVCGRDCDGSPNPLTGKGPPVPMIVGLADGFSSTPEKTTAAALAPRTGPAVEVFARRRYTRLPGDRRFLQGLSR